MQIEATGKSVEIAIQNGLLECGKKREEVEIKVVEQGGLFKKSKVLLVWGEETKESEPEQKEVESIESEPVLLDQEKQEEVLQQENKPEQEVLEKPKKLFDTSRVEQAGKEFLLGLVRFVDENAQVESTSGENEVSFSVKGENLGKLIGFHGENIQAVQMLLGGIKRKGEGAIRLYLDIDGYKANRNQALVDLANKIADQAVKIERNIHMDPLNPYERRIVHTTLQGREDVTTESTGEGEKRHVVVKPIFKK